MLFNLRNNSFDVDINHKADERGFEKNYSFKVSGNCMTRSFNSKRYDGVTFSQLVIPVTVANLNFANDPNKEQVIE